METSHRHSTVSTLLSAFFALTFICHGVSSLAQTKSRSYGEKTAFIISKIDDAAAREFQEAWRVSLNGSAGFEGLVLIYSIPDGSILSKAQGRREEIRHFTFRWTVNITAVVHTHPNGVNPMPSDDDLRLADGFGVPVFTITQRGMYVYDPESKKISIVQDGLDWLESAKWSHDGQSLAKKR